MGNLCGKESPSSFNSTGRVLGGAPNAPPTSAHTPQKPKISGQGKTLGGSSGGESAGVATDARAAAAQAAEARNTEQEGKGRLASQLSEQRRKTQSQHLADMSKTKGQQGQLVWD